MPHLDLLSKAPRQNSSSVWLLIWTILINLRFLKLRPSRLWRDFNIRLNNNLRVNNRRQSSGWRHRKNRRRLRDSIGAAVTSDPGALTGTAGAALTSDLGTLMGTSRRSGLAGTDRTLEPGA